MDAGGRRKEDVKDENDDDARGGEWSTPGVVRGLW